MINLDWASLVPVLFACASAYYAGYQHGANKRIGQLEDRVDATLRRYEDGEGLRDDDD